MAREESAGENAREGKLSCKIDDLEKSTADLWILGVFTPVISIKIHKKKGGKKTGGKEDQKSRKTAGKNL